MEKLTYFNGKIKDAKNFLNLLEKLEIFFTQQNKGKFVCVDLDNTFVNTNKELKKRGYDISVYPHPELTEDFWLTYEGLDVLIKAKPIKTTFLIFDTLYKNFNAEIFFTTSRNERLKDLTYAWMLKNRIEANIYFTKNKLQLDADIYIEDDPAVIRELLINNKTVLIPTWEYNKDIEHPNAIHFNI